MIVPDAILEAVRYCNGDIVPVLLSITMLLAAGIVGKVMVWSVLMEPGAASVHA